MKKIISALTLSAIVAGAAFADVSATCNYRQRATLLSYTAEQNGSDATARTLFADAYSAPGTDNLAIKLEGDIASFEVTLVGDESTTSAIRAKTLGANLKLGKLQTFAGFWSDGKVKGAYRNKTDIDAGNIEGMDFEYKKLGSAYAGSPSFFVDNLVLPVRVTASESYAIGGVYNFNTKAAKFNFNLAYISNETSDEKGPQTAKKTSFTTSKVTDDSDTVHTVYTAATEALSQTYTLSGIVEARTAFGTGEFVFKYGKTAIDEKEIEFNNESLTVGGKAKDYATSIKTDGSYKLVDAMAFGAYLQPVLLDNLTVTVGGAGSVIDGSFTDYSADLRLYYKLGNLSFTSFNNYSAIVDAKENAAKLNGKGNATTKGIADSGIVCIGTKGSNAKHGGTPINADSIISNNLMIRYKVNNTFSVFGIFADMLGGDESAGVKCDSVTELRASAWAQFYTGSSSICVGFVWENYDSGAKGADSVTNIAIPMVFRVKM